MKRPKLLYHFTSLYGWHFIRNEGITRGECPVSFAKVHNYPNLTADPDPAAQGWAGEADRFKDSVRIAVKVPRGEDRLEPWAAHARRHNIPARDFKGLTDPEFGNYRDWWIFRGIVRPAWFVDVEILRDEPTELERSILERIEAGDIATSDDMYRLLFKAVPFHEALALLSGE